MGTSGREGWKRAGPPGKITAAAALLSLFAAAAGAGEPAPVTTPSGRTEPDFTELTLEELLRVDLVFAASRRSQAVGEAPSMVTIIGRDEIRHQRYRTLAELFRSIPGFYVSTDHNYTYLGVRGFSRPGDYNSRVLVLLNGARLNDNVYDSVLIGNDFVADLDLVERVEIARGPAASLYGNNAFFAVVNIVTRKGADLSGGEVTGGVGSFGERRARAAWGTRTTSGLDVVASVSTVGQTGQDLCFPEYEAEGRCARGLNGEAARRGLLTLSWKGFQAQALHSWRRKEIPTGAYATAFGDGRNRTWDAVTRTSVQYAHTGARASVTARLDHGRYRYSGHYVLEGTDELYQDGAVGRWWTLDTNTTFGWGAHHLLTAGTELQWDPHLDQHAGYPGMAPDLDTHPTGARGGVYLQDEVRLTENLRALLGARFDVTDSGVRRASPRLGLVHSGARGALKLLYGEAFRAPNQYERDYFPATSSTLGVESIRTLELVAERSLTRRFRVSAAAFDNRIAGLVTLSGEAHELMFVNSGRIQSRGLELVGDWRGSSGARARASYSLQRTTDAASGLVISNSPAHLAKANLDLPLFSRRLWLGSSVERTSARTTLAGATLPGFTLANLAVHAPVLRPGLALTLGASNLFDTRYAQPGSEEHRQDALEQAGRVVSLEASWRF